MKERRCMFRAHLVSKTGVQFQIDIPFGEGLGEATNLRNAKRHVSSTRPCTTVARMEMVYV